MKFRNTLHFYYFYLILGNGSSIADQQLPNDVKSGISFTACLAKFSFCIFHPYGKQYGSTPDARTSSGLFGSDRRNSNKDRGYSSRNQQMSGRKDSLSLNVEFIKFNFSRNTIKNLDDQKTSVQISGELVENSSNSENAPATYMVGTFCCFVNYKKC